MGRQFMLSQYRMLGILSAYPQSVHSPRLLFTFDEYHSGLSERGLPIVPFSIDLPDDGKRPAFCF